MGKLLDEIKTTPKHTGGVKSKIDLILEKLDTEDRADLLEAINDHTISVTVITRVLRGKGFDIQRSAVQRYRGLSNEP